MAQKFINWLLFAAVIALISILGYRLIAISDNSTSSHVVTTVENMEAVENRERERIQDVVKEYIMNNPEVLIDSIEQMQKRKMKELETAVTKYIDKEKPEIENRSIFPVLGNRQGDIIIVSFYDYNCGYCKKGEEQLNQVLASDNKVSLILRPFPILGEVSLYTAKAVLAVHKIAPEKFQSIHTSLMQLRGITVETVNQLITNHEIDLALVQEEMTKPEIQALLDKTFEIANNLKIHGVPAYIINGSLLPGMIEANKLQSLISEIRANTTK